MKLKTQIAVIAVALGVSTSLVSSQDRQPRQLQTASPTLVGVWQALRHGVNCDDPNQQGPSFPSIMTFHSDGTMTTYFNPPGTGPLDIPEVGVWQREPGAQNYSFRDVSYAFDENGVFALSGVVTATVHLDTANSFTYSSTIEVYDADGNLLFTFCGAGTGTRFE